MIGDVGIGFDGMADRRRRPARVEAATGRSPPRPSRAAAAVAQDFQPIDDWRGTAAISPGGGSQPLCAACTGASPNPADRSSWRPQDQVSVALCHDSALKHAAGQALTSTT